MLPIAARQADVWHGDGTLEDLRRKSSLLDEHARRVGRDPASIARATSISLDGSLDQVRRRAESLREIGFSYLIVGWPSEGKSRVEEFARLVIPGR